MKLAIFKKNTAGAGTKKYPLTNYRSRSYNPYAYQTSILQIEYIFDILGGSVTVRNERLAKALQSLTERKRDIILLSYFLDMTDREIAEKLNMVRKTVQYQRTSSLKALKKRLEDSSNEQDDNK